MPHIPEYVNVCNEMGAKFDTLLYHTEIRWLSRGKVLNRIFELRDEITLFLELRYTKKEEGLLRKIKDQHFIRIVAYLVDIFNEINNFNTTLQGSATNIITYMDKIDRFIKNTRTIYSQN